jgi:23S rRNA (guanine745-N1)-methyltransferase
LYSCPVCQLPLEKESNRWRCEKNHSFDCHKKGYVNLLLAQNKRSKSPGDDVDMVVSRRRFLEAGHYQPLAKQLSSQILERLPTDGTLLDAGCGEGYYTAQIAEANPSLEVYGLDISKPAITAAAKYKGIFWSVASSTHAPFLESSFDALVSVFSRVDSDPFYRLLKPGGYVAMAAPDHDHLMGLRHLIYEEVKPYDTLKHTAYFDDRFKLVSESRLEVPLQLESNQALMDLLGMTPHAHRLPNVTREKLQSVEDHIDKACFKIYWFQKADV